MGCNSLLSELFHVMEFLRLLYLCLLISPIVPAAHCSALPSRSTVDWSDAHRLQVGEGLHYRSRRPLEATASSSESSSASLFRTIPISSAPTNSTTSDQGDRVTSKSSPSPTPNTATRRKVLAGTMTGMMVLFVAFLAVLIIIIIAIYRYCQRRRVERELVMRTKQDIFEGVPNVIAREEISNSCKYSVDCSSVESPNTAQERICQGNSRGDMGDSSGCDGSGDGCGNNDGGGDDGGGDGGGDGGEGNEDKDGRGNDESEDGLEGDSGGSRREETELNCTMEPEMSS